MTKTIGSSLAVASAHGAEVSMAGSTAEAVERCAFFRPHVLLTDLGMPNQDGFDLLSQIRAWEVGSGDTLPRPRRLR